MDKKILINGHVGHEMNIAREVMKLACQTPNVLFVVTPDGVSKPVWFEAKPFVITNPYENMPKLIEGTGFVSRKERRKRGVNQKKHFY